MKNTNRLELYIILLALILALVILVLFWALNRGDIPEYTLSQPSPTTNMTTPVKLETATDPSKIEQSTASYQGLAKIMEPTTIRALVLGDSVAESLGVSNRDLSSWHTLVANALHTNYPGTIQWHFKTSAAASINDVLTFVPEATIDTDLIVLCLGRQDVGRLRLTVFKQKYEQLIVELKAKSPHADLYLVVEPPVLSNSENTKFLAYRKIINDLGQKHQLHVIDAWTAFINDPTPLSGLLADSVYPNDKGYRVFADAIIKGFTDYLALQAD